MFGFNYVMQELVQLVEPRSDLTFHQHQFNSDIPAYSPHTIYKITQTYVQCGLEVLGV